MGVARSIEQRLEGLVEGFFTKVFRSGLQPVEVGRRILREMAANKTVSVNRMYAPNDFRVLMGPSDFQRFDQMAAGLQREFSDLIIEAAKESRWNLMGMPRISFAADDSMGTGEFKVEAALTADPDRPASVSTRARSDAEAPAAKAIDSNTADRLGIAGAGSLVILDSEGKRTDKIALTSTPVVIGRLSANDVVLADPNVSRRHAELRRDGSRWILVDLDSTNGTLVNGKLAREHEIKHGDRLSFGTSELIFEIEGAR